MGGGGRKSESRRRFGLTFETSGIDVLQYVCIISPTQSGIRIGTPTLCREFFFNSWVTHKRISKVFGPYDVTCQACSAENVDGSGVTGVAAGRVVALLTGGRGWPGGEHRSRE